MKGWGLWLRWAGRYRAGRGYVIMSKSDVSNRPNGKWYASLGLTPDASDDAIREAYLKLAKEFHPDVNPGDEVAEKRFKEIAEAYAVLSDPKRRGHTGIAESVKPPAAEPKSPASDFRAEDRPVPPVASSSFGLGGIGALAAIIILVGGGYLAFAFSLLDFDKGETSDVAGLSVPSADDEEIAGGEKKKVLLKYEQSAVRGDDEKTAKPDSADKLDASAPEENARPAEVSRSVVDANPAEKPVDEVRGGASEKPDRAAKDEKDVAAVEPTRRVDDNMQKRESVSGPQTTETEARGDNDWEVKSSEDRSSDTLNEEGPPVAPEIIPVPDRNPSRVAGWSSSTHRVEEAQPRGDLNEDVLPPRDAPAASRDGPLPPVDLPSNSDPAANSNDLARTQDEPDYRSTSRQDDRNYPPEDLNAPDYSTDRDRLRGPDYRGAPESSRGVVVRRGGDLPSIDLPDGAGFSRWVISRGQLCWIEWSGTLRCGSQLRELTPERKRVILERIRRKVYEEGQPVQNVRRRFDRRQIGRRARSWVNENGDYCYYDYEGFVVCDRP